MIISNKKPSVYRTFRGKYLNGKILCLDAIEFLKTLSSSSADIVFLDPPFNLGKKYSKKNAKLDQRPEKDYFEWMEQILTESSRILKKGGTVYLYHIPKWALRFGNILDTNLDFRHWIAVSMKNGFVRGNRLYPAHYALLMFSKGAPSNFDRPKLSPKQCRHCGGYVKDYGGYTRIIEEKGINLTDFWEDISPVRHSHKKFRNANELPSKIFERVIHMSGGQNGIYVDPFSGSGSGIIEAAKHEMHFLGNDVVEKNCSIIIDRLELLRNDLKKGK